jgi:hypothetical protein
MTICSQDYCDPSGVVGLFPALSGGIAALNPRLLAGKPPGCNRPALLARRNLRITISGELGNQRKALPPTPGFRSGVLVVIHKSLREQQNPEGIQAISRGLSAAIPPDRSIATNRPRRGRSLGVLLSCVLTEATGATTPPGSNRLSPRIRGYRFAQPPANG